MTADKRHLAGPELTRMGDGSRLQGKAPLAIGAAMRLVTTIIALLLANVVGHAHGHVGR